MKRYFSFSFIVLFSMLTLMFFLPLQNENSSSFATVGLWSDYASSSFSSGNGTQENPYIIDSAEELALMAKKLNGNELLTSSFKITSDINLELHNWVPIKNFQGKLDGQGYNIKNITINNQDLPGYYFIDSISGNASVSNLLFTNIGLYNQNKTLSAISLIQSLTDNSRLDNIHIISGTYTNNALNQVENIAGLLASGGSGTIVNNCSTNINIVGSSTYTLGGITGLALSKFTNCYCYGSISTDKSYFLGGFAGQIYGSGTMENCFSKTNINLESLDYSVHVASGGLIGHLGFQGTSKVMSAYYKGNYSSLYGMTDLYEADKVYLNLTSLNELPENVWTIDEKINDGDPFLKDRYWEK